VSTITKIEAKSSPYIFPHISVDERTGATDERQQKEMIAIEVSGKSFRYRQIRSIVGCLVRVGQGKLTVDDVGNILRFKKRYPSSAPAHGLYLADIQFDNFGFFPHPAKC